MDIAIRLLEKNYKLRTYVDCLSETTEGALAIIQSEIRMYWSRCIHHTQPEMFDYINLSTGLGYSSFKVP